MPQPSASFYDECRRVVDALDVILAEESCGRPSHTRLDGHVDQAVELATSLIRSARGPGHTILPAPRMTRMGFGG